jgi:oligoribonuclease NrnB/cAMP/cGMP phosphodiesterase (DHH superfamily)
LFTSKKKKRHLLPSERYKEYLKEKEAKEKKGEKYTVILKKFVDEEFIPTYPSFIKSWRMYFSEDLIAYYANRDVVNFSKEMEKAKMNLE